MTNQFYVDVDTTERDIDRLFRNFPGFNEIELYEQPAVYLADGIVIDRPMVIIFKSNLTRRRIIESLCQWVYGNMNPRNIERTISKLSFEISSVIHEVR